MLLRVAPLRDARQANEAPPTTLRVRADAPTTVRAHLRQVADLFAGMGGSTVEPNYSLLDLTALALMRSRATQGSAVGELVHVHAKSSHAIFLEWGFLSNSAESLCRLFRDRNVVGLFVLQFSKL
jgi:hypothetical protein